MAMPPGRPPGGPAAPPPQPPPPPPDYHAEDDDYDEEESEDRARRAEELRRKHARLADPVQRLNKLKELYEAELISEEEFKAKRAEILDDI